MKRSLPLLFVFFPFFVFSHGFTIRGTIDGLATGSVSLDYRTDSGEDTTQTTQILDGKFTLTGKAAEPELVRLAISHGWSYNLSFFLENSAITLHMIKDAPEKTTITGSVSDVTYQKLKPGLADFFENARVNAAYHQYYAATHDGHSLRTADSAWAAQQGRWLRSIRSSIAAHPDNYAALYFIQWLLFRPGDFDTIRSVFMQLSPEVRRGWAAKKFLADFDHLAHAAVGQHAPEISGSDTSGRPVTLSSFDGKVILLDFWASYCGPCRQENKKMLPFYALYHDSGFEIVSFSLDDQRERWIQAILADGLVWPQASELRGGASASAGVYDITDLPRNVLIDRHGKIFARDLHDDALTEAVKKLLDQGK